MKFIILFSIFLVGCGTPRLSSKGAKECRKQFRSNKVMPAKACLLERELIKDRGWRALL